MSLEELAFFMLFSLVSPQILSRQEKKKKIGFAKLPLDS